MRNPWRVGLFCLLAAVWGTAYVVTNVGLRTVPPTLLAALRFDLAALVLFGYVWVRGLAWRPQRADWYPIVAGGVFLIALTNAFLFAGQQYVTSAVAAVIVGLVPVVTPPLNRLLTKGKGLTPLGAVGVCSGFAGVFVIANPDPVNFAADVYGAVLVFVSAVAWALGTVLLYDRTGTLSLPAQGAWMMAGGALLLHAAAFVNRETAPLAWSAEAVVAVGYLGIVSGVGGYLVYLALLDVLGPIEVSLLEYVIPLFAALVGWFALGEVLSVETVAGFGLIVAGFVLVKRDAIETALGRGRPGGRLKRPD